VCQCGQVRGPVSLHFLQRPGCLGLLSLSSSLVFNIVFLSLGHILACSSVCLPGLSRRWPYPGFSQRTCTNTCRWTFFRERKIETERVGADFPGTAETHTFRNRETDTCWTNPNTKMQSVVEQHPAQFTRSQTSPLHPRLDMSLV